MDVVVDPAEFIARAVAYAERAGLKTSTLARKIFSDSYAFDRIRNGRVTYETLAAGQAELERLEAELANREAAA